jgi:hypothetical protein
MAVVRARVDDAVRAYVAGEIGHWSVRLGATLPVAARTLGVLWQCTDPVPADIRETMAARLGCIPAELTTYARLARRMMRELPRAFRASLGAAGSDDALVEALLRDERPKKRRRRRT